MLLSCFCSGCTLNGARSKKRAFNCCVYSQSCSKSCPLSLLRGRRPLDNLHTGKKKVDMDAGRVNEPVWTVALQQQTQTDNMPTHTTTTTKVQGRSRFGLKINGWRVRERRRRRRKDRTHRWLPPSGPGAARPRWEAVARGRFPWRPQVLQLPCGKKQNKRREKLVKKCQLSPACTCTAHWLDVWCIRMKRQSS